ncbi:MAG: aminotransferase class V-fold PLP-dependent enzyme [Gemmatimonadales bacterium]|nr:aminotransferase class V-fold PLP-dependent enzyme [Gemmatimonadales bacterium]
MLSRRRFLGSTGLAGLGLAAPSLSPAPRRNELQNPPPLNRPSGPADQVARDEAYWGRVAANYRVSGAYTNLEAGYFGMMAGPVLAAYHRHIDRVNLESSFYARRGYDADLEAARARVAAFLGVAPAEVAFTRGATEALQCLIGQYNRIRPGDVVMYADLDYNAMQFAINWLVERRGATVARLVIPEPATRANVLAAYAEALEANPRVRLLLLTHLNNKTGLILPVHEIAGMARARGVDVVVDAAHSFGQVELKVGDLGADFVGCNLHKWLGTPVGVGVMYIKEGRLGDVDRMFADESAPATSIQSRIHTGTANFANFLTVPAALDFHEAVGPAHKAARLRYLRDRWVREVRATNGIDLLTPDDPGLVAAITSLRVHGRTGKAENQAVVAELFDRHRLFTVWRTGLARGDCVRVTPALYNTPADAERLAAALKEIARRG